ncbi:MAG: hypothetical protein ACREHG_10060, partial [Candidatus Saccharimonadales bacterium]
CRSEEASAGELQNWLNTHGHPLSLQDRCLMTQAILSTIPAQDTVTGDIFQPNLKVDSHPVVRCLALADMGGPGMEGGKIFLEADTRRFMEFHPRLLDILCAITRRSQLSNEIEALYLQEIRQWLSAQDAFARGRKRLFEFELGNLSAEQKAEGRKLFCRFDESIEAASRALNMSQHQNLWQWAAAQGYPVPPD